MIFDAQVEVTCDGDRCKQSIYVPLHAGARNTYNADDDSIEREIRREGWTVKDGKHYCESCADELKEKNP